MALLDQVRKTVAAHHLFEDNELVLAAVSGGPDSTAMLHALHSLGYRLVAAHLNHMFRGQEAEDDANYVRNLCDTLDIPVILEARDVPSIRRQEKVSAQQAARRVRYEFLEECAASIGAKTIATAHTRDDRVESIILNIVRGSGTDGLRGIPFIRGRCRRPLLESSRMDVIVYCEEHGLEPRHDSSNDSSSYSRNNVRKELLPYLERRYNESVRGSLLRLSEIATSEAEYIQDQAIEWLSGNELIPIERFKSTHDALQRRIVREWIRAARGQLTDIDHDTIDRIRELAGSVFVTTLPGGDWLVCGDSNLMWMKRLVASMDALDIEIPIVAGERAEFFGWRVRVQDLPLDLAGATLSLRTRRVGDRVKTLVGTQKLQDIFTDRKIPRVERSQWPVLTDTEGILAVPTLCVSERARGIVIEAYRETESIP